MDVRELADLSIDFLPMLLAESFLARQTEFHNKALDAMFTFYSRKVRSLG